jgi:hypothetical protein
LCSRAGRTSAKIAAAPPKTRQRIGLDRTSFAWEIARMSTFAVLAIAWIPVAVSIVIGFGFFLGWLDDRAEKRSARHAAE